MTTAIGESPKVEVKSPPVARAGGPCEPMVLHVRVVTGHGGGPEKTILNSPRFLREMGFRSKLAYLHPPGDPGFAKLQARGRALDAEVLSVPDRGPFDLSVIGRLAAICRENNVAIWHGHDYKSNLLGLLVGWYWPCKLVTTVHGWGVLSGRMPLYNWFDRLGLRFYRATICVSDDLRETCLRAGVPPERCRVVYNAIDTQEFHRTCCPAEAKQRLGAPSEGLLIGAVGRLSREKRFDLLIDAMCRLRQNGHAVSLWIAGDGNERQALETQIAELDCQAFVRLLGHVTDPREFYEALDLYVLSSDREGLPNVVLEAMAMGVPVVATRVAGVPMLLEDGACGMIVEPSNVEAMVNAIQQLAVDPQRRLDLVRGAYERVASQFLFSQRMLKVAAIYKEVLKRGEQTVG